MNSCEWAGVVWFALLVAGAEARGDGFPGPLGRDMIQIRLRFDGLEAYPDYDFYVRYGRSNASPFPPRYLVPVTPGTVHLLPGDGQRMSDVVLVVVPHGQKPIMPAPANHSREVEEIPGEMRSNPLPGISGGLTVNENIAGYILPFRVAIHDGVVEVTQETAAFVSSREWIDAHPITKGFWLAAVITVVGLGFARWCWRARRRSSEGQNTPAAN